MTVEVLHPSERELLEAEIGELKGRIRALEADQERSRPSVIHWD